MLGLATAIAILAMLLASTLRGLWSYYVTVQGVKSELEELDAAEKLKSTVADLHPPDQITNGEQQCKLLLTLEDRLQKAETDLKNFETIFQQGLGNDLTPGDSEHIAGLLGPLRTELTSFGQLTRTHPDEIGAFAGPTPKVFEPFRLRLQEQFVRLSRLCSDLHQSVRDDLAFRIRKSRRAYQVTFWILVPTTVLGIILMLSALRTFYHWIFNPVRDLQEGVTLVAGGNFEHRIEVDSGDEMEELAAAFNDMTCRLRDLYRDMAHQINERSRQLVRSERLASVGFLAAGVAHEINNPLASIAFCSEALEARLNEMQDGASRPTGLNGSGLAVFAKYLKMIQEEAFRCKNITERLLEFSRGGERKRERTDLVQLVQSVLDVTQHLQNSKGKEIVFNAAAPVVAWVNAEEIKSVVLNLVVNALDSMDEGGRLTIGLSSRDGMAEVVFRDTGCGMTAEVLENIFEPFFTRNRSGKGTGLGLTITHRIVSQHGGEIEAASPGVDQGSTFRVRLPLQPGEAGIAGMVGTAGMAGTAGTGGTGKEESFGHAAA
jgi:signal transduction histidine kinase